MRSMKHVLAALCGVSAVAFVCSFPNPWHSVRAHTQATATTMLREPGDVESDYERLLKSYAAYKKYGNLSVGEIEQRLTGDRLNTVQGLVRAAEIELSAGDRLVGWMSELRGIWGVRPGQTEGRHQFRLSVVLKPGFRKKIGESDNFESALGAHVLLPVQMGGDDDPAFANFKVDKNARTWRQVADSAPRAQVSQLKSDESVGEIDLDFDSWTCHTRPSNSDSGAEAGHSHVGMLNAQFPFGTPLKFACRNSRSHCDKAYAQPYCD